MSQTSDILNYFIGKESATLKEVYGSFQNYKVDNVRSILNMAVKKGRLKRVGRGAYALVV